MLIKPLRPLLLIGLVGTMATDDPKIMPEVSQPQPKPIMLDTDKKKRPRWLRWIGYVGLTVLGLFLFFFFIGLFVGKAGDDATAILHKAATDQAFATSAGITGTLHEAGSEARVPPPGLKANFYWSRPSRSDAEIVTFDTAEHAKAAFEFFTSNSPSSLLVSDAEGTTVYSEFSKGRVDSPVEKVFRCAQREHTYACGSIPAGVPAIVTVRLLMDADWNAPSSGTSDEDVMAAMQRKFAKTDVAAKEMAEVDNALQRLGIGTPERAKQTPAH